MIMEPMASATEDLRERQERQKFKTGLKSRYNSTSLGKRQRDGSESGEDVPDRPGPTPSTTAPGPTSDAASAPKRRKGPKGANPLSVKKPKSRLTPSQAPHDQSTESTRPLATDDAAAKKKRKRKAKPKANKEAAGEAPSD
jgi:U3 small nucleolar RNA-associated protein 23